MSYADRTKRPPRTPTDAEVKKILKVTGSHLEGFRDHVIISLATGGGLRESEIVALNIGDVRRIVPRAKRGEEWHTIRLVQLRVFKRAGLDASPEDHRVHLPDATFYKLEKYLKASRPGYPTARWMAADDAPLFVSKKKNRLSTKQVRTMFRKWQIEAGIDHPYKFHALRHYAITAVRRRTGNIRLAQLFARHANLATTTRYDHVSDEELAAAVKELVA